MSDETTLLPCPFCGGEAEFHIYNTTCLVECSKCHIGTTHHLIEEYENAIAAWNTRAELGNGTLTAEQVRELIAPHLHARPTFDFGCHGAVWWADFQAIADKLNAELESETCEMIPLCSWLFECSKCSEKHHKDDLRKYNYCPNCGARIRKQVGE